MLSSFYLLCLCLAILTGANLATGLVTLTELCNVFVTAYITHTVAPPTLSASFLPFFLLCLFPPTPLEFLKLGAVCHTYQHRVINDPCCSSAPVLLGDFTFWNLHLRWRRKKKKLELESSAEKTLTSVWVEPLKVKLYRAMTYSVFGHFECAGKSDSNQISSNSVQMGCRSVQTEPRYLPIYGSGLRGLRKWMEWWNNQSPLVCLELLTIRLICLNAIAIDLLNLNLAKLSKSLFIFKLVTDNKIATLLQSAWVKNWILTG